MVKHLNLMSAIETVVPEGQAKQIDEKKTIKVRISSVVESGIGCWLYNHFCIFPNYHVTHRYDIRASMEGFCAMCDLWKQAGYTVILENDYPK